MILCKTCTTCLEIKPVSEFSKMKTGKYGVRSICKSCSKIYSNKYYNNEENKVRQKNRIRAVEKKCKQKWAGVDQFTTKFLEWSNELD